MASEIRVNKINNRAGLGTITIADTGVVVNGIVTCTEVSGLNVLNIAGVSTFANTLDINGDIDVDGHTNLDNLSVAGVSTFSDNITLNGGLVASSSVTAGQIIVGSGVTIESNQVATGQATFTGIVTASSFRGDGSQLTGVTSVGGNTGVDFNDNVKVRLGTGNDLEIYYDGTDGWIKNVGKLKIESTNDQIEVRGDIIYLRNRAANQNYFYAANNAFVGLTYAGDMRLETESTGIKFRKRLDPETDSTVDLGTNAKRWRNIYADTYYGDGSNLTGITSTTINSNADNRVITGSGTANTLNAESNLTYNGNILTLNNDADQEGILMTGGDVYHTLTFDANRNIQNYSIGDVRGKWNGTEVNRIRFNTGADTTNRDEGWITFWTRPSGGNITERLRIGSDGQINIAGILTATTVTQRTSKFYGLTTTERNALSPTEGDIIYNTTTNKHEFYSATSVWAPISATPPAFDNASGSLATFYSESRSTTTLSSQPTASGDAPITYSIASGSLPSGMSINTSTGVISGTPNAVGSDTTSNFTVQASNAGGAVTRDYSITVKAPVTTNYSYTGSTVSWSKPSSDVKRVLFRMWGGAGTHGTCTSNSQYPGRGGKTEGVINVESHSSLYLQVGEAGGNTNSGPNGGWPNGGNGNISHQCKGSGGGGSSNIYHSSGTGSYTYIVAVAGGGGSVSHGNPNSNGGDGGGTNGGSSNRGGGGGTQNAGGSQGLTQCGNSGNSGAGTRLQGGTAGTGSGCTNAAAGGGGGWWGGGAGGNSNSGNTYGGGGGGSGYFDTSLVSGGATKTYGDSGWSDNKPSNIAQRAGYGDNNRGGMGHITLIY